MESASDYRRQIEIWREASRFRAAAKMHVLFHHFPAEGVEVVWFCCHHFPLSLLKLK
jgi:hypothetical protein